MTGMMLRLAPMGREDDEDHVYWIYSHLHAFAYNIKRL